MANNYEQATVHPYLPRKFFNESDLEILELSGFLSEEDGDSYYFYAPEYLTDTLDQPRTYLDIFQSVIHRSEGNIDKIVIEGAFTCSELRPCQFGGFVTRITATRIQTATTRDILKLMQGDRWPLPDQPVSDDLLDGFLIPVPNPKHGD